MILDHYIQLFFYYRKLIAWIFVVITGTVASLSVLLLFIFPFYTGTATVQLMPTEAELAYMTGLSSVGLSGNNPAQMLPATQIEYLLSRPVAERVIEKVQAELDRAPPPEGWRLTLKEAMNGIVTFVWMVYNTLNSGKFVEPTPYEQALTRLMRGIDLETVENSYVLQIEVTLPQNAQASALAANALAEAYIERLREQSATTADALIAYLDSEIARRLEDYKRLQQYEFELRKDAGILALEQERDALLASRDLEQERLLDIRIEREELEARLKAYEEDRAELRRRGTLALVEQEIALSDAQLRALDRREALRTQSIERINAELADLNERENPLLEVQRELTRIEEEMDDLRNRRIIQNLSKSGGMSQLRIVNPAVVPAYASFPEVVVNTVVAIFGSIFIVLIVVVAADTLSGSVKTTIDLRRLAGGLALGRLPKRLMRLLRRGGDAGQAGKLQTLLRKTGAELEYRMAANGLFDHSSILVAGFGSREMIGNAALAVAGAMAARGSEVRWHAGGKCESVDTGLLAAAGIAENADSKGDVGQIGTTVTVECVGPVAAGFSWREVAKRSAAVICVFQEGGLSEEELLEFRDIAARNDVPEVAFIMVPS